MARVAATLRADAPSSICATCSHAMAMRGERFAAEAAGLYLDYSKQRITGETLRLLIALADACGLRERIEAMFRGDKINTTENRAVLHVALRAAGERAHPSRRQGCGSRCARGARSDGGVQRTRAQRRMDRPYRQAHPQRGQHRHRRIGPRPGDGVRGAAPLQPSAI